MKPLPLILLALCVPATGCVLAADAARADSSDADACSTTVGHQQAETYAQQCIEVSPATHPPCHEANPCDMIVDEIKRGCAFIDEDAPAFCADY